PAPAPPPPVRQPQYASLLGAIDPALADRYGQIMTKKRFVADTETEIGLEKAEADKATTSASDKKAYADHIKLLEGQVDQAEDAAKTMTKAFVPAAKASAQKASGGARDKFGAAVVNLHQAVEDANISNGAAAVRFPMAVPTMLDSTKQMVPVILADIVEE